MTMLKELQKVLFPLVKDSNLIELKPINNKNIIGINIPVETLSVSKEQFLTELKANINNEIDFLSDSETIVMNIDKNEFLNEIHSFAQNESLIKDINHSQEVITIDMSSPNIAKPMSYQHFRSTIIGNVIANVYDKLGYNTVKINHLGDWGVPLASIILAIQKWGDIKAIEKDPMIELDELYRLYLTNLQMNPYLEEETLQTYKKLNYKEEEVYNIWKWLKDISMNHFNDIYETLGVTFDSIKGESFYNNYNDNMIDKIEEKSQSSTKHDSLYLTFDDQDVMIQDTDGHSNYLTRDLAAAYYRYNHYNFDKALYVIGKEQTEHFIKLKHILSKLGFGWSDNIEHIGYSPVMIENDQNETPNKQNVLIMKLINNLTQTAKVNYQTSTAQSEKIAVNSLIFETLDKYRDEILTINIDHLDDILNNPITDIEMLINNLKQILNDFTFDENVEQNVTDEFVKVIWLLGQYPYIIETFKTGYDSIVLTRFMISLWEITHKYVKSIPLHDIISLNKMDYLLIQSVIMVLEELFNMMGLKNTDQL